MAGPAKTGRSRPGELEACSALHITPGSRMSSEQQNSATEPRLLTNPLLLHGIHILDFVSAAYVIDGRVKTHRCMEGDVPSVLW